MTRQRNLCPGGIYVLPGGRETVSHIAFRWRWMLWNFFLTVSLSTGSVTNRGGFDERVAEDVN